MMKSKIALCSGLIFFIFISNSAGQKKSETINETIQNTARALSDLFHKKKNTADSSSTHTTGNNSKNPATNAANKINKPVGDIGKLAPNVKYIDADAMLPFNHGAALIEKGSSTALIGPDGNFIIPYNTYQFKFVDGSGLNSKPMYLNSGIFQFNNNNSWENYMNSKGKIISTSSSGKSYTYTEDKRMLVHAFSHPNHLSAPTYGYTYLTSDGNKYTIYGAAFGYLNEEGIGVLADASSGRWAYAKLDGTKITGNLFDEASPFSDGMASVGKADAFERMKYGFINEEGKLVIPFTFSVKPGNFSCGYAKVYPLNKSDFEYAFINKKGEIVFKQTLADQKKYGEFSDFYSYGLAISSRGYFLTSDFKLISRENFFTSFGIPAESRLKEIKPYGVEGEKDPKLYFTTKYGIDPLTKQGALVGFINLATKKVVMPCFYKLGIFDPVSHLAYAEVGIGRDIHGVLVRRRGYVNEQGEFVIIQGSGSKW